MPLFCCKGLASCVERRLITETRNFRGSFDEMSVGWSMKRYHRAFGLVPWTKGRLEAPL